MIKERARDDVKIMVFANKMDDLAEIEVTDDEIAQFESQNPNIQVVKTSGKYGTNIGESFLQLINKMIDGKIENEKRYSHELQMQAED